MEQKYHVNLSEAERKKLKKYKGTKKHSMEMKRCAEALLELDESNGRKPLSAQKIGFKVGLSRSCVEKYRKQFTTIDIDGIIGRKKRETPPVAPKVTGEVAMVHSKGRRCGICGRNGRYPRFVLSDI